jgi:uncharacterized RmlC-like cupin family protein
MKKHAFLFLALATASTSCTTIYHQAHRVVPEIPMRMAENSILFEDENCTIAYDFGAREGGDAGFLIHNKTDNNIHVNLDECYFVLNGMAHDYYQNKVLTISESVTNSSGVRKSRSASAVRTFAPAFQDYVANVGFGAEVGVMSGVAISNGVSASYQQKKIVTIPPGASKKITGFVVNETIYDIKSISFSKGDSPIVFENHISYQTGRGDESRSVVNRFYISEITNLPERRSAYTLNGVPPDRFIIRHTTVPYARPTSKERPTIYDLY